MADHDAASGNYYQKRQFPGNCSLERVYSSNRDQPLPALEQAARTRPGRHPRPLPGCPVAAGNAGAPSPRTASASDTSEIATRGRCVIGGPYAGLPVVDNEVDTLRGAREHLNEAARRPQSRNEQVEKGGTDEGASRAHPTLLNLLSIFTQTLSKSTGGWAEAGSTCRASLSRCGGFPRESRIRHPVPRRRFAGRSTRGPLAFP